MAKLDVEVKVEVSHIEINAVVDLYVNGKVTVVTKRINNLTLKDFETAIELLDKSGFSKTKSLKK